MKKIKISTIQNKGSIGIGDRFITLNDTGGMSKSPISGLPIGGLEKFLYNSKDLNGWLLIKTDIAVKSNTMIFMEVSVNGYTTSKPSKLLIQGYDYVPGFTAFKASIMGESGKTIGHFIENDKRCFAIAISRFQSICVRLFMTNMGLYDFNLSFSDSKPVFADEIIV